jgi:hypothetical protein
MQETLPKNIRISLITAISTSILAFVGIAGLILALTEFIDVRTKFLRLENIVLLTILVAFMVVVIAITIKRWVENVQA